jgi:hypothetical protein
MLNTSSLSSDLRSILFVKKEHWSSFNAFLPRGHQAHVHNSTGRQVVYVLRQIDISEIDRDSVPLQSLERMVNSGHVMESSNSIFGHSV